MDDDTGTLPLKEDFSAWYNEILWRAEIMDVRYPVKGLYVWFPYGFALRKYVYQKLRDLLDRDHQETLFPLLIPEQEFMKEAEHIKGFEEEVYWVTHGGTTPLEVKLALRPTSETAIYPMYALWVRSHADLPIKYYQIVNTFRYETKQTRPLIRLREITSFKELIPFMRPGKRQKNKSRMQSGSTVNSMPGFAYRYSCQNARTGTSFPALIIQ